MTNTRTLWISIASLVLILAVYITANKQQDESITNGYAIASISGETNHIEPSAPLADKAQLQSMGDMIHLQEKVLSLTKEVVQLRLELNTLKQASAFKTPLPVEAQTPEEHKKYLLDPAKRMDAELHHQEEVSIIETAFHAEPRNTQWASDATSQIQTLLDANHIAQNSLHNIECHSKTCRVELSSNKSDSTVQTLPSLFAQLLPALPSITTDQIDAGGDSLTTVFYLSAAR